MDIDVDPRAAAVGFPAAKWPLRQIEVGSGPSSLSEFNQEP